jgi:hypothetical protein
MSRWCRWFAWLGVLAAVAEGSAEERAWEVRAAFVGLKPGDATVAIFQLPDKSRVELPLTALSVGDRDAIRAVVEPADEPPEGQPVAKPGGALTVRGPLGRSVVLAVPELLKGVETDAVWCETAADAARVYRLFLAGEVISAAERTAAEQRLAEWEGLAAERKVRQGDAWVTPEQRAEARSRAEDVLEHGIQLLKLGNAKLAEAEIEKASRLDPETGRAEFVLGLAYGLGSAGPARGLDHFVDAVRRDPEDPWAASNLAVCEFAAGRYPGLPARFREVIEAVPQAQVVADNLGIVIGTGPLGRVKVPDRVLGELNGLYRQVVQHLKLTALDNVAGRRPTLVSPYGAACQPGPASTLPAVLVPPPEWVAGSRTASGVVVAAGHVLTSRRVLPERGEVWIEDPTLPGRRLPATEVASLEGAEVALVRCDALVLPPLAVGDRLPDVGGAVAAASCQGMYLAGEKPEVRRGAVVAAADLGGACVHSSVVPRGLGGGPIVDDTGRLVGLVAATPRTESIGNTRGLGIPIEAIWPLLEEQLADLQPAAAGAAEAWEAIEPRVAAATVRVIGVEKRVPAR